VTAARRRLGLIPARGGSKRFPRKNVALFDGVPLVVRAVRTAHEASLFDAVVVSTEDAEIASLAREAGAEVHRRDTSLASDDARVVDVCRAVLAERRDRGERYDDFCVLLPTSPFRTARHVRESLALLDERRAHVVMSTAVFPHVPWWAVREERGFLRLQFGARTLKSRHTLPVLRRHNGVVLWSRTDAFLRSGDFYGPRVANYPMAQEESVDIDEPLDLEFATFLSGRKQETI
jgi:CMP-N-acetylneuraminic acid synthetase